MARTQPDYRPPEKDRKAIQEVLDCVQEAKRWHNQFARKVERRYEAWRGMLPENSTPAKGWRSNQHPPFLINIVEGMLSQLEDQNPIWNVKPRALPYMQIEEAIAAREGAEVASHLLSQQMRIDGFSDKGGPLAHQDLIAGLTVGKVFWLKKDIARTYLSETPELIYDEAGGTIDIANKLEEYSETVRVRDDPTLEIRDVRDFMYPESAQSLEAAPWVIDRTWVTYKTLERMQELGVYKDVKYVKETRMDESNAPPDVEKERELRLRNIDRTRGLVEIIELWTDDKVVTLANRRVLLRNIHTPFNHGRKPFVVCSAIPDLFQIPGVSVIEGLAQMQEMLWTLTNMRMDATRIASNVITLIRGDVEDPGQFDWAPEAQWIVPDPNAVHVMDMTSVANAAQATLQAEGILRGDIQNIMGGMPFTGGSQSQTLPTDTATGVSIVTNIAQAILARRKGQHQRMFSKVGQMFLELDQQFIRETRLVEILGEDDTARYIEFEPTDIDGIYDVDIEVTGESLMRQERRSEWQSLTTFAMQAAAPMAQSGTPLNVRAFWEELLERGYDIRDKERFFSTPPATQSLGRGAPGTTPQAQTLADQMSGAPDQGGITNASLAAGPSSPSSSVTMSPTAPMQRSLAATGAGRSA